MDPKMDVMGCLQRDKQNPKTFTFDFRFRHYQDDRVFDSEDVKHWYHVEDKESPTEDDSIHKVRQVLLGLCEIQSIDTPEQKPKLVELLYRDYGDFRKFMDAFSNQPWAYAKLASPEDEQKYGLPKLTRK
jgi:hypothetical protein